MKIYDMLLANAMMGEGGGGGGGGGDLDIILAKTTIIIEEADNAYASNAPLIPFVENELYIIQFVHNDVTYQVGAPASSSDIYGTWGRDSIGYYQGEDTEWYLDLPVGGTYTDFTIFRCPMA